MINNKIFARYTTSPVVDLIAMYAANVRTPAYLLIFFTKITSCVHYAKRGMCKEWFCIITELSLLILIGNIIAYMKFANYRNKRNLHRSSVFILKISIRKYLIVKSIFLGVGTYQTSESKFKKYLSTFSTYTTYNNYFFPSYFQPTNRKN